MRVKFILPALTEATSIYWRSIKYSLFPPLALATLAGYLDENDETFIEDEHVQPLSLDDVPDLVAIQTYITSAYRAYQIADHYRRQGSYVVLGGLHASALPAEAAAHSDTILIGPAEEAWPRFLRDFRNGQAAAVYRSTCRTLERLPMPRHDLIRRSLYLAANSLVVSRGCPHHCDFSYKDGFYAGGRSFYHQRIDRILAEIDSLPGRHLFFLDDHLFGDRRFALELFRAMRGMNRIWQAAGTVRSVLDKTLFRAAVESGLASLFIGFETLNRENLQAHHKSHNLPAEYHRAVQNLHDHNVMINGSFIFGLDGDAPDVFERTVQWAVENSIETATFHILTPYPGTRLYNSLLAQNRIITNDWDLYDTRHAVFMPRRMSSRQLEEGYRLAYRQFYSWKNILISAAGKKGIVPMARHLAYSAGWKKFEGFWEWIIRRQRVYNMTPLLEKLLSAGSGHVEKKSTPRRSAIFPLPGATARPSGEITSS